MSDHSRALVSLEAWAFSSPDVKVAGHSVDIGSFAEALIYYDTVYVNLATQPQLAEFITWFERQDALSDLFAMLASGDIRFLDFSFITTAVLSGNDYHLLNIQDPLQARPDTFEERFLYHRDVQLALPKSRHRERLIKASRGKVVELKADQFGRAIDNAHHDSVDPQRASLVIQAFVDEIYATAGKARPPKVAATVTPSPDGSKHHITWNVNLEHIASIAGTNLEFHLGQPLTAVGIANRLIWAAAGLDSDLYLSRPMGRLVGNKLFESSQALVATRDLITELTTEVDFPDVRSLVNAGHLTLADVFHIRKKAKKFRRWLQDEADRDRNALIAYHHELAQEAGLTRGVRRVLPLFAAIGAGAASGAAGFVTSDPGVAAAIGGAGPALTYLIDVALKLGRDWRPVVFGNWLREYALPPER